MKLRVPGSRVSATGKAPRRAAFIDKDGTLVENVPYNVDPEQLRFTRGAVDGLRRLSQSGWQLAVISNQPGLAAGRFDLAALERVCATLVARLADEGVPMAGVYVCPHAPHGPRHADRRIGCACRKPAPGLLLEAAQDLGVDLERSWMVGDILDDVEAGWRAGCGSVLLDVGNETEWRWAPIRIPDFRVPDLLAAADAILGAPRFTRSAGLQRHPTIRRPSDSAAAWRVAR